jgi:hypothetical protein
MAEAQQLKAGLIDIQILTSNAALSSINTGRPP